MIGQACFSLCKLWISEKTAHKSRSANENVHYDMVKKNPSLSHKRESISNMKCVQISRHPGLTDELY